MPTDPISGLSGVMQALRQRMAARSDKSSTDSARRSAPGAKAKTTAKKDISELKSQIAARLGAMDPSERDSPQAARIFVESALAWEFGEEILSDPEFARLASDVQQTIASSPETGKKFAELLKSL